MCLIFHVAHQVSRHLTWSVLTRLKESRVNHFLKLNQWTLASVLSIVIAYMIELYQKEIIQLIICTIDCLPLLLCFTCGNLIVIIMISILISLSFSLYLLHVFVFCGFFFFLLVYVLYYCSLWFCETFFLSSLHSVLFQVQD